MNDVAMKETGTQFKWVGTRPVRPDGVPKVTGLAQYGADFTLPGMLWGKILRSPHAHARIRSIDTSKAQALPGVKAVMTVRGPSRAEVRLCRPRARRREFLAHDAQHHGAREGPLRGPRRRRRRRDQHGHRRRGAAADRSRLRGAAARHRRRRGDEARCAAAVRGHDHARHRAARRPSPRTSRSGSSSRSATSRPASPRPTRSWR